MQEAILEAEKEGRPFSEIRYYYPLKGGKITMQRRWTADGRRLY